MKPITRQLAVAALVSLASASSAFSQTKICPTQEEVSADFSQEDLKIFFHPEKVHYPETWFHYINGNVDKEGITKDLEAIAGAGISGIQLFHGGNSSGNWPGVREPVLCMDSKWNDLVSHTASEASRLGLRFTMQNCPGWSMAGGPWIKPENSIRNMVQCRTDITGGRHVSVQLPKPYNGGDDWKDYREICVLAFPTPEGDTASPLVPSAVNADQFAAEWQQLLSGKAASFSLKPSEGKDHQVEIIYDKPVTVRSVVFSPVQLFNHSFCYEPGIDVKLKAFLPDGSSRTVLDSPMPMSSWQDDRNITFAIDETTADRFVLSISNAHDMKVSFLYLMSSARKNNWESEAGWTLRNITYDYEHPQQSAKAFIRKDDIMDISACMNSDGKLEWDAPSGNWTVLRIGHVNAGMKNSPAPPEATGWECDKLSTDGADVHFANYIGKINAGPAKGILNAMLLDSWECKTQTWTVKMESEFREFNDYELRNWLPAVFGYVIEDHETSARFLNDWRACINYLFSEKFYGRMAENAKANGLNIQYETAAGDVFPADILQYYKHADVPMCEFWSSTAPGYVGSFNFKPSRMTASASRLYGKTRVSAESLTSFELTWDEHFSRLKEVANQYYARGVTHSVFHTYTHNPCADTMFPGTSFGNTIGSPFLRGQTWWKHMPELTTYLARLSYMLERGKPVSDVLWYLGDGSMHKPDEDADFPAGFKFDYCNQDILLNRISVKDGKLVTPEGISYSVLWIPDNHHILPATAARLKQLLADGAVIIADRPLNPGTLVTSDRCMGSNGVALSELNADLDSIWGSAGSGKCVGTLGKGRLYCSYRLEDALRECGLKPDLVSDDGQEIHGQWIHRQAKGADWYFITALPGEGLEESILFECSGKPSLWNPVDGKTYDIPYRTSGNITNIDLSLPQAGSCFIVFDHTASAPAQFAMNRSEKVVCPLDNDWTVAFPEGWDAPSELKLPTLVAWKDMDMSDEAKAFAGTAVYTKVLNLGKLDRKAAYHIDLGAVEEIAKLFVNGQEISTLWCPPYRADITTALKRGDNEIRVEVTSTWFNRLVWDAGKPEGERKTWVLYGPEAGAALRSNGLLGPVSILKINSK